MRSSLIHLYRIYNVNMPLAFDNDLRSSYLFHCISLYVRKCDNRPRKVVLVRTISMISWKLMCRVRNAVSIRFQLLDSDEDARAIWLAHVKIDQEGDRQCDPRQVYANPKEADIYPILALTIYITVFGFNSNSLFFPGNNQNDRCSKIPRRPMNATLVARELEVSGRVKSDFGSHSVRKGTSFYVSGCCTGGPLPASICLRTCWKLAIMCIGQKEEPGSRGSRWIIGVFLRYLGWRSDWPTSYTYYGLHGLVWI
ncbi:hypothetical protein PHMEG_0004667 [Phytophthora megakarya]|uniref:Uncharacterized protein n=1 Tax=Phytophthora megakarya TaxID=4795 RepID=A0A225WUU2_9STRA|nr:hypothetical protein PHMEG_0004667 [Phytophthora megakarya]